MDGQALDFEGDSFDIVGSQFGVMLFPDLQRGLNELVRVAKPDGRLVLVTLGAPSDIEFLEFFLDAIEAAKPDFTGFPVDPPPLPFRLADPERLRDVLVDAGLRDVSVETTNHRLKFESGSQMWRWVTASNPIGAEMAADLTAGQKASAEKALNQGLRERAGGQGPAVLNNLVNIALGTK